MKGFICLCVLLLPGLGYAQQNVFELNWKAVETIVAKADSLQLRGDRALKVKRLATGMKVRYNLQNKGNDVKHTIRQTYRKKRIFITHIYSDNTTILKFVIVDGKLQYVRLRMGVSQSEVFAAYRLEARHWAFSYLLTQNNLHGKKYIASEIYTDLPDRLLKP